MMFRSAKTIGLPNDWLSILKVCVNVPVEIIPLYMLYDTLVIHYLCKVF